MFFLTKDWYVFKWSVIQGVLLSCDTNEITSCEGHCFTWLLYGFSNPFCLEIDDMFWWKGWLYKPRNHFILLSKGISWLSVNRKAYHCRFQNYSQIVQFYNQFPLSHPTKLHRQPFLSDYSFVTLCYNLETTSEVRSILKWILAPVIIIQSS